MRDHRTDRDPTPTDITDRLHAIARRNAAVRVTPPDWRLGRPKKTKTTITKKARRQQQAASRKRNR